jgi:NAD(P)-dependent dehydrogenase (short-subunit alcohol dehydrogenase family)
MGLASHIGRALTATFGALAASRIKPPFSFHGRSVLITGGSRGLGLLMARELIAQGAHVAILARDGVEVARAAAELRARGGTVLPMACDVRDQRQVAHAVERTVDSFGRIDVLINNAGVIQAGPIEHASFEDFADALAVHFWGPLYAIDAALPYMRRQGGGRIVNISSIGGKVAVPHLVPYCASKYALCGLSEGLRAELAKDHIVVTTATPGLMRTGSHMNARFKGRHSSEYFWFSLLDSLPMTSVNAGQAAHQILEGCRRGAANVIVSPQAQFLLRAGGLLPELVAPGMALFDRLLPSATDKDGNQSRSGWESRPGWMSGLLTRLSDRAAVENNGLGGQTIPAPPPTPRLARTIGQLRPEPNAVASGYMGATEEPR